MNKLNRLSDIFEIARSQSLAKENLLFLHHRSLENMVTHLEKGNQDEAIAWAKIYIETVSRDKLEQISKGFTNYTNSFGIKKLTGFHYHITNITKWCKDLIRNTYEEAHFQKRLVKVFNEVQQPGVTLRASLSDAEKEAHFIELMEMVVRREILLSDPITNKDEIIKDLVDSDFLNLISPLEKAKSQEQQKRPKVIAIFQFVQREFPELNKTAQAKLAGYVCGAIGIFDSLDEHNGSERKCTYPAYLANAARNHLRASKQI